MEKPRRPFILVSPNLPEVQLDFATMLNCNFYRCPHIPGTKVCMLRTDCPAVTARIQIGKIQSLRH